MTLSEEVHAATTAAPASDTLDPEENKFELEFLVKWNEEKTGPPMLRNDDLEHYLSDAEFEKAFEISRPAFAALPKWKRIKLKREHSLW